LDQLTSETYHLGKIGTKKNEQSINCLDQPASENKPLKGNKYKKIKEQYLFRLKQTKNQKKKKI
jgi:hypothetical protein